MIRLNQAIQDLDMQIEEQKMKIESTVNQVLRVSDILYDNVSGFDSQDLKLSYWN